MMSFLTTLLVLIPVGPGWHGHGAPAVACCDTCGVKTAQVHALIFTLQTHPKWRERDDAAHELREFDWRCHPEIPLALATAMLSDCHEEVREEAAESLAKLAPCLPEVHAALVRAEQCDPDHATRKWARRALKKLDKGCIGACTVCGPVLAPVSTVVTAPLAPALELRPLPAGPPLSSPLVVPEAAPVLPGDEYAPSVPSPYDLEPLPPLDLPPALPPTPSPFLPGASRAQDSRAAELDNEDLVEETIRQAAAPRRSPIISRIGQRLLGGGR